MRLAWPMAVALVLGFTAPAWAAGTVRIQQHNDTVQMYTNVDMRIVNNTLKLTSADGVSTVVISGANCAKTGDLTRCTGGGLSLAQDGNHPIPFRNATFYFNMSDQDQMLPLSTMKLGPHSVVFSLETAKGTYITGNGTLDRGTAK